MKHIIVENINIYYDYIKDNQSDFIYSALEKFKADNPGTDFEFTKNDKGRPTLLKTDYDISFTHSNDLVICAIGKGRIGVDAEYIRTINYSKIAKRSLPQYEASLVTDINSFFRMWTRYEARYKLDNSLLTPDINYYDIPIATEIIATLAKIDKTP